MKKLISTASMVLALAIGAIAAPAAASADATPQSAAASAVPAAHEQAAPTGISPTPLAAGQYEYICLGVDGNSWSLQSGQPLTDCHGSKLLKYINGSQVATYNLSPTGEILDHASSGGCVLAFASGVGLVLWPPTGAVAWVYMSVVTGAGFSSCIA